MNPPLIAVVIPCYRTRDSIRSVIGQVPASVQRIYVVDDACPQETGEHVRQTVSDERVTVVTHSKNLGVGGAMITGYRAALAAGADIVVKMDGDGQMDAQLLPHFIEPIVQGRADYTKGNRFFELGSLSGMPPVRLFGNAALSLVNKFASGYWDIMDPTNGYTAVHAKVLKRLPLDKIANRYFFESDMLFRLGTIRAVVLDVPMKAVYGEEQSSLRVGSVLLDFPGKYLLRIVKRLFYSYFLRDFNAGTLQFVLGFLLLAFGTVVGLSHWMQSISSGVAATSGTVMLAALPVLLGGQLLIGALNYDIANVPRQCLHPSLN